MRRKNRPSPPQPLAADTAERLGAIVEAAERAAVTVIDDAEKQAQRHLDEARIEADRLASERLASLEDITDSLIAQAEAVRSQSESLLSTLHEAKRRLGADGEAAEVDGGAGASTRASHLTAVAPLEEELAVASLEEEPAGEPAEAPARGAGRGTPAGARLLATQMAVSGNSREEIEARLRNGFEIEDTASILDAILGPDE